MYACPRRRLPDWSRAVAAAVAMTEFKQPSPGRTPVRALGSGVHRSSGLRPSPRARPNPEDEREGRRAGPQHRAHRRCAARRRHRRDGRAAQALPPPRSGDRQDDAARRRPAGLRTRRRHRRREDDDRAATHHGGPGDAQRLPDRDATQVHLRGRGPDGARRARVHLQPSRGPRHGDRDLPARGGPRTTRSGERAAAGSGGSRATAGRPWPRRRSTARRGCPSPSSTPRPPRPPPPRHGRG